MQILHYLMEKPRLIVIEDDEFLAHAYQQFLRKTPYEVSIIRDGAEAIKAIWELKPHLIILDLILPHVTGIEILRTLRGNPATASIPIIIASNIDSVETKAECNKLGIQGYFIKSNISLQELSDLCQKYLRST